MNQIFNICRSGLPIITCRLGLLHKFPSTTLNQSKSHLFCSRTVLDPNTNVIKDVMLFKYENPKLYKAINFFALAQFCFWNYVSYFSYTNLRDAPVADEGKENLPFWQRINLGESKYRTSIAALCFLMGYGILFFSWMYTLRSVRFLILRKGGQKVTFVTYAPFGENRIMEVPVNCVSAVESRQTAKSTLPLKVKNRVLFYVMDMRGEFKNPMLFDQTAGMKRAWMK